MTDPVEAYQGFSSLPPDARVFPLARPGTILGDGRPATGKEPPPGTRGHLDAAPANGFPQIGNYGWALDGQFILVDFDAEHPARAEWEARCPETWMQRTRRGTHRVYRVPAGWTGRNRKIIVRNAAGTQAIIGDLKSRGYLVGPGSVVMDHRYEVLDARDPAPAPDWLLDLAAEARETPQDADFCLVLGDEPSADRDRIEAGRNDEELIAFAGFLRRRGFNEAAMARMLGGIIDSGVIELGDPNRPYTLADARRIARSAATYEVGQDMEARVAIRPESWVCGSDTPLVEAPIAYWLRRFVPKAALVGLYGPGGIGKSTWLSRLAADVTRRGGKFLHVGIEEPFRLFLARAVLMGADRSLLWSVRGASRMQFPRDIPALREAIVDSGTQFVYFDSIYSHFAITGEGNAAERSRAILGPLAEIAQTTGATIMYTFHENKAGAYLGSVEMANVARSLLSAKRERGKPLRISVVKTNDPAGPPDYHLEYDGVEVEWRDPETGEVQMEEDDDGKLAPIRFMLPTEARRVDRAIVVVDDIEDPGEERKSAGDQARRLQAEGRTTAEIATELGISTRQVFRYLNSK